MKAAAGVEALNSGGVCASTRQSLDAGCVWTVSSSCGSASSAQGHLSPSMPCCLDWSWTSDIFLQAFLT